MSIEIYQLFEYIIDIIPLRIIYISVDIYVCIIQNIYVTILKMHLCKNEVK